MPYRQRLEVTIGFLEEYADRVSEFGHVGDLSEIQTALQNMAKEKDTEL
jgi:hypothetical protein